ncbi:DUF4339 domain-containing protein [Gimesia aquarii]|uniref:GYF domain-containing protein n=1 Tax=Gimesia aquarii TaxID=2527964 RepID=A0A517VX10_9PLAN|nr:DUF4339 domain-containing protein [Gimesia aquarii]QDT97534.1 hypothetical protein V144x_30090 [Gimesia aquarii]
MASDWYYKQDDQELGPYTFRDLVEMVREEKLTAEVLVRPHYTNEWQRADSVVGLFHMARRDPATLPPVKESAIEEVDEYADAEDIDALLSSSDEVGDDDTETDVAEVAEKPGWLKRLLSLRNSKIPAVPLDPNRDIDVDLSRPVTAESSLDQLDESVDFESDNHVGATAENSAETNEEPNSNEEANVGAYSEDTWSSAIDAAVERIDSRAPKPEEAPVPKQIMPAITFSFLDTPAFRKTLQASAIVLCASLAIYGFVDWMGQGTLFFPLIGDCSPLMFLVYSVLTFAVVIVIGSLLVLFSSSYLRIGFKLGSVIVTANLTAYMLLNWSDETVVTFPTRNPTPTEAKIAFPLIGECSSFAYWMYFVDVIIFVAVFTYFVAWWLEAHADDV